MALAPAAGCDVGPRSSASLQVAGPLNVVGFNADASMGSLPVDGTVQIAFDRLLHPGSVTRQSFAIRDASGNFLEPVVTYDPVARVVSLVGNASGPWLQQGATYEVIMGVSKGDDWTGGSGPRAIDGATLTAPVTKAFQALANTGAATGPVDRPIVFCDDVLPIFQRRCSASLCHGAPQANTTPAEGLILQTADGVYNTALRRVSQESNTGALAGLGQPQGHPFGVDMPIVDPGNPGNSWLLYKVLLGQTRPVDQGIDAGVSVCGTDPAPGPVAAASPQPALALPASEHEVLSQYILGNQMPYPLNIAASQPSVTATYDDSNTLPLPFEELERVRAWIAQGANVAECSSCRK